MADRKIRLLGLPQDSNSSFLAGTALAPPRIREAFHCSSANLFTETGVDLNNGALWSDDGDVLLDGLAGKAAFSVIQQRIADILESGDRVLSLGGDHSVTYPVVSAYLDHFSDLNILHFDAHPDLYENMLDNPYSHASPFARLMETGRVKRLVQVGIRTLNRHQREQAERYNVEIHEMRDLSRLTEIKFTGPVYLSFDLDALDPAFAPGVSHYEPGGLSTREALNLIHSFGGQLVGADVVELNPIRDPADITAMVAAKICKELMGRMILDGA